MSQKLPDFASLLPAFREDAGVRQYAEHNFRLWRRVIGGLRIALETRRDFDPRRDYWRCPERRLLVAYFSNLFAAKFAPPSALRSLAYGVFRHYETARQQKAFGDPLSADLQATQWSEIADQLRSVAGSIPEQSADFVALRGVWGAKALGGATVRESLTGFIDRTEKDSIGKHERRHARRYSVSDQRRPGTSLRAARTPRRHA